MEVTAIKKMVIAAWEEDNYGIGIIVSDDDTTMKSHLKHSFKQLIEAGKRLDKDEQRFKNQI